MLRYKYAGIRERKIQMSRDDRHVSRVVCTSIGTVTQVTTKIVEKGTNKQKGSYEYRTEHKTRTARKTGRTTDREEFRARSGEAQRAEAAAHHRAGPNRGAQKNLGSFIPGVYLIFFHQYRGFIRE